MKHLIVLIALMSPAHADTVNISGTEVTLQASEHPGAIAEVIMLNRPRNGPRDNSGYVLEEGVLHIPFTFTWNVDGDSDAVTLSPPDGVICVPTSCRMMLHENGSGTILLFEGQWLGF